MCFKLPRLKNWNPPGTPAKLYEILSFLGPFFSRPTGFPDSDPAFADTFFAPDNPFGDAGDGAEMNGIDIGARNPGNVKSAMTNLRGIMETVQVRTDLSVFNVDFSTWHPLQGNLYTIIMAFIKASPEAKEGVIQYMADVIKANEKRGRMQVDRREVSSDGYLNNLQRVCLKLCDPIMDARFSKVHLIDPDYFISSTRLNVTEDTKINADKESYEAHLSSYRSSHPTPTPPNFVSDIFFLTVAMHHYGLLSTLRYYGAFCKEMEEMRKQVNNMKAERDAGGWAGPGGPMQEALYKRFQTQLDKVIAWKLAMDAMLMDHVTMEHSIRFYGLVMMWLVRCAAVGSPLIKYGSGSKSADAVDWGRVSRGDTAGYVIFLFLVIDNIFTNVVQFAVIPVARSTAKHICYTTRMDSRGCLRFLFVLMPVKHSVRRYP